MKRNRMEHEKKIDTANHYDCLETDVREDARKNFKRQPYKSVDVAKYIAKKFGIGGEEAEIKKLEKKKRFVQDKVRGSNPDWPYEERSFSLGGSVETAADAFTLAREKRILEEQRKVASDLKLGVEEWMKEIPFRMQRIIRYKIFSGLSWEETATLMKCKGGGETIRKEVQRFLKKN